MKIGLFTDAHYCRAEVLCGTRRPSLSLSKIREAMESFRAENVDICICLGDLTDHAPDNTREDVFSCFSEALKLIRSYGIPFHFVPGNHDYLMLTAEELMEAGLTLPPYKLTFDDVEIIALDANYRSDLRRFDEAGVEWTDANLPPEQCRFLEQALAEGDKKKIVCIHENLDPNVDFFHIVKNAEEIRQIIKDRAVLVLQGHYHKGAESIVDGIPYLTLRAMCEGEENAYRIVTV